MSMEKISIEQVKKIAKEYGLKACKVKTTGVVQIRKHVAGNLEDISWDEFAQALKEKKLAVYKAENSDFLKIMKERK